MKINRFNNPEISFHFLKDSSFKAQLEIESDNYSLTNEELKINGTLLASHTKGLPVV